MDDETRNLTPDEELEEVLREVFEEDDAIDFGEPGAETSDQEQEYEAEADQQVEYSGDSYTDDETTDEYFSDYDLEDEAEKPEEDYPEEVYAEASSEEDELSEIYRIGSTSGRTPAYREDGERPETSEYYGIEEPAERPARKIVPKEQEKTRSLRLRKHREQNLARFSNIYMLSGMLIGVLVFYFLVIPDIQGKYDEKFRDMETSYNQTISTKNNEIDNLNLVIEGLSNKNTSYESQQTEMQATIDKLTEEVETLKRTIESGGLTVTPEAAATDAAADPAAADAAAATDPAAADAAATGEAAEEPASNYSADRNNANVIGISGNSIEDMISNE